MLSKWTLKFNRCGADVEPFIINDMPAFGATSMAESAISFKMSLMLPWNVNEFSLQLKLNLKCNLHDHIKFTQA